jgi:hypothetical protein
MPSSVKALSYTPVRVSISRSSSARQHLSIELCALATDPLTLRAGFGKGTADGIIGDHILLSPPLSISSEEVQLIVRAVKAGVDEVFGMDRVQQAIQEVSKAGSV